MGLIKFIKNIFSKKKEDNNNLNSKNTINEEKIINKDNVITQDSSIEENYNKSFNNLENNQENYLENERLLKLKYLNDKNNIVKDNVQTANVENITINQLNTIWDIIKIKENTQAEHLIKSIPSDKWVSMDEIRHNIKLTYNVEYSNEKSLYPYLKTLTDINLIKVNNTGKKRTWKKNIILIKEN